MKTKKTKGIYYFIILIFFPLIIMMLLLYRLPDISINKEIIDHLEPVTKKKEYDSAYIVETCFDGSKEVHPALYAYPFQRSKNYIKNKELIQYLSIEESEGLQARAVEIITDLYSVDSRLLRKEYITYQSRYQSYFSEDSAFIAADGSVQTTMMYISKMIKAICDARLISVATFETDKSLIYQDGCLYVRGLIELSVYEADSDVDLNEFLPFPIEMGKSYNLVYEIGLVPEKSFRPENYVISRLEMIAIID